MSRSRSSTIYVGNLPLNVKEKEVEDLFKKFGYIKKIELRTPMRPPAYCFVEYDDSRDAEDAVHHRDGYEFAGDRLRVEVARGGGPPGSGPPPRGGGYGGYGGDSMRGLAGTGRGYKVFVEGLPSSASWQDLKDHFRPVARPMFSNVMRDRRGDGVQGIVEFQTEDDVKRVVRKLDRSTFKNMFQEGTISAAVGPRVYEEGDSPPRRRRSYSRSGSRSRSRSRSPSYSRSRSRSGRKSPRRSRSRSPRKSPRRSPRRSDSRSKSPARSRSRSRGSKSVSKSPSPRPKRSGSGGSGSRSRSR